MKHFFSLIAFVLIYAGAFGATANVTVMDNMFMDGVTNGTTTTINVGDMVTWTVAAGSGSHTITSGSNCTADGKFDSGNKKAGESFSFTFTTAGTYPYFCTYHCSMNMIGSVVVNAKTDLRQATEAALAELKSYPNPFSSEITLSYTMPKAGEMSIVITDVTGKTVQVINHNAAEGLNTEKVNVATLPKGMYIAKLSSEGISSKGIILVKE